MKQEKGQAIVEFALQLVVLLMLTGGVIDVGRGFYQYNALSVLARYGARWGGVEGGMCALTYAQSTSDFCNQLGDSSQSFWSQPGNAPLQTAGTSCPSYSATPADYYTVSAYEGSQATTIVGAVAQHFDSNNRNPGFGAGMIAPGFDLSKLEACIALSSTTAAPQQGDSVTVSLYYPFAPVSFLLARSTLPLSAVSTYEVE